MTATDILSGVPAMTVMGASLPPNIVGASCTLGKCSI